MSTVLRDGKIIGHTGRCQDCATTFQTLATAKRHSDRLHHTIHWDVTYRRTITPNTPQAT